MFFDLPSDPSSRKKAPKKPAGARRKKTPRKAKSLPTAPPGQAGVCNRSPCGPYDPKLSMEEIEDARELVARRPGKKLNRRLVFKREQGAWVPQGKWIKRPGQRGKGDWVPNYSATKRPLRPYPDKPLAIAYGLGLDSTAILVGLVQEHRRNPRGGWRPDVITFADVGSEKQVTYDYLERMNAYLEENGFPQITVVSYWTGFQSNSWGSARTLEQQVLINQSGPSITEYFGRQSKCSSLWKQAPQNLFMKFESGLWEQVKTRKGGKTRKAWRPIDGTIVKAIGYDATEERRMAPDGGGTGATYRTGKDDGYFYWYPLVDWGWDRARCRAEVEREMGEAPPKSSCFFCFAMKPEETVNLSLDEARRSVFMELVRKHGRQAYRMRYKVKHGLASSDPKRGVKGLAGKWSWTDLFVNGAEATLQGIYSAERRARIDAMVHRRFGRRTMLTKREVAKLDRLAAEFVSRSADKGRSVQVKTLEELKKDPAKRANKADVLYKGQFDLSEDPWVQKLPAWSDLKGFRGTGLVTWERQRKKNPAEEQSGFTSDTLRVPADLYGIAFPLA